MFVARRDLRFAKGRFALMGSVVALLTMLMVLLTGLAAGLVDDNISAVRDLPADHLAFDATTGVRFSQSVVDDATVATLAAQPGVTDAAPLGNALVNGTGPDGAGIDLALFGVDPGSFLAPTAAQGQGLGSGDGVVISPTLADKHAVGIGDTIHLDRVDADLQVVGVLGDDANYGHVPVAYAPIDLWRRVTYPMGDEGTDKATLVALRTTDGFDPTAAGSVSDTTVVTRSASFAGSPGYAEETGTLTMIKCFLYLIGAVLVGAFFAVWTVQRKPEIGLLKALGASNAYLLRDALGQALAILTLSALVGLVVSLGLGAMIPNGAPFAFVPGPVLLAGAAVVALGLLGAAMSVRRITSVDPLIALGGAR